MPNSPHPATQTIRLLVADVDGTLVDEAKQLTPAARAAVQSLHDAGIAFAITSGRPPRGMAMLIEPLALRQPVAGFNGGAFVTPDLGVLETRTLDPAAARRAVESLLADGLDAWIYRGEDWYLRDPKAAHVEQEARTVAFGPSVVRDFDGLYDRAIKIVGVSDDPARLAKSEAALRAALGTAASVARSQPYYLDVTHPDANKGAVVEYLAKYLDVPLSEIASIGDMPNDVRMFARTGLAIAMGNAKEEVRAQAHVTTRSNSDDGFAHAVQAFVLPRAPK
jgi:Cof subfamily protein (haloacid dehalogenase superfamily)